MTHPYLEGVIHNMPLLTDHYKVLSNKVYPDHVNVKLHVPFPNEETTKGR